MSSSQAPSSLSHSLAIPFASRLSEQLSQRTENTKSGIDTDHAVDRSRSLGPLYAHRRPHALSPTLQSRFPRPPTIPSIPDLLNFPLNLPSKTPGSSSLSASNRAPLSPKLDSSQIYSSPGSVLPRRSRGLDFSRACTNLHHSTLAEASPDSSPTVGGRGVNIPQRRGSLGSASAHPFSTSNPGDRTAISSSVSSINMMESDTSSSEEDDEPMIGDRDDFMITNTPQAKKFGGGVSPFAVGNVSSPGSEWMGGYSQAAASLMSFQRARFRKGRSRHSSSSGSSKQSPGPLSPPVMKSIENPNGGYFAARGSVSSRRGSLSLGTRDLRLSDVSDEGEHRAVRGQSPNASNSEGGPLGVIRRAVTRRGSLLPKTKTFARIRAALMEEGAPIDSEAKREAEVIRQVRESEPDVPPKSPSGALPSLESFMPSTTPHLSEERPETAGATAATLDEPKFSDQAHRNSGGINFWNSFDERYRTPPPPPRQHGASSVSEDDLTMDFTPSTTTTQNHNHHEFAKPNERPGSRSEASSSHPTQSGFLGEQIKRKRRRDDDFDPNLFKRRAVSPSMSAQSSPIMPNSPAVKDTSPNIWGAPRSNLGSLFADRPSVSEHGARPTTSGHSGNPKRVGLQGMNETNDGLMNMSIE